MIAPALDQPRVMKLRVRDEDGTLRTVEAITSNEDHVGNLIAEGDIPESERHRHLARIYRAQLSGAHRAMSHASERDRRDSYARGWVARWLADTECRVPA